MDVDDKYDGLTADEIYEKYIKGTDIEVLMQPMSAPDDSKGVKSVKNIENKKITTNDFRSGAILLMTKERKLNKSFIKNIHRQMIHG